MDKWKNNKGKFVDIGEDSLLPPTRRISSITPPPPPSLHKRRSKKWSIDGIFKSVFSKHDAQSSSSSFEDLSKRHKRKIKGKVKDGARTCSYGLKTGAQTGVNGIGSAGGVNNGYEIMGVDKLGANCQEPTGIVPSRSSDGSFDGRRALKDKVKARAEAKRVRLGASDSSTDESSGDETAKWRHDLKKRISRGSRTERYLKRMCNGSGKYPKPPELKGAESRDARATERVPRINSALTNGDGVSHADSQPIPCFENGLPNGNYDGRHEETGVNVLIQQTLQYFNDYERSMEESQLHKERKAYPAQQARGRANHRSPSQPELQPRRSALIPPKPPSRDYRLRIQGNGASVDKYHRTSKSAVQHLEPRAHRHPQNDYYDGVRSSLYGPNNTDDWELPERAFSPSSSSPQHQHHQQQQPHYDLPLSPPRSPLREPLCAGLAGGVGGGSNRFQGTRNRSPPGYEEPGKPRHLEQPPRFSMVLQSNDYGRFSQMPLRKAAEAERPSNNRRSLKTLEEAMCELESIYNSLQLADEELLDRAEQRTMEEFHYKGFTASPENFDAEDLNARRKTWGDPALSGFREEQPEVPDRLRDDMAYRRMHPKERPSSVDGQASLSSISYLMTSPIPSRRDMHYIDPKRRPRRKEPDVTLDDVVFRSMHYANNTLKVVEPQPPFGIPLGPITTATDSDYLHTRPSRSERSRSPYIPSCEPDLVTDDLAFRNLRKDTQPNASRTSSSSPSFNYRKKRAVRSLSANLYGLINTSPGASTFEFDSEDQASSTMESVALDSYGHEASVKRLGRRTSDPEVMRSSCQNYPLEGTLQVRMNGKTEEPRRKDILLSDIDTSNKSWDESADDRIQQHRDLIIEDEKIEYKGQSDRGSSYVSSNSSTPSLSQKLEADGTAEQEVSVYQKLCQDLENLVQLTKGIDDVPGQRESSRGSRGSQGSQGSQVAYEDSSALTCKERRHEVRPVAEKAERLSVGAMIESIGKDSTIDEKRGTEDSATSLPGPIKREISTILDSLKELGEDSNNSGDSSCSVRTAAKGEGRVAVDKESFNVMTKEICDADGGHREAGAKLTETETNKKKMNTKMKMMKKKKKKKNEPDDEEKREEDEDEDEEVKEKEKEKEKEGVEEDEEEEEEEEERKDRVDEKAFFRNIQLAKLGGDWKEGGGANGAVINRRTSLTSEANWEGMNKCNHKYNSMPAKTSSLLPFRHYGSKRKSNKRKSMCSVS